MDKAFWNMTLPELREEREKWDKKIREATHWGASLVVASEFRDACDVWIARLLDKQAAAE